MATNSRRPIVAGNWKMNLDHVEAIHLVQQLALGLRSIDHSRTDIQIYPPFTDLRSVEGIIGADNLPIELGAQHCSALESGAYTGEVSVSMLARLSVTSVLVGHSERRQLYGMTDEIVNTTVRSALQAGLRIILCVGEGHEVRESGSAIEYVTNQITNALDFLFHGY